MLNLNNYDLEINYSKYANGRTAIALVDREDGMPFTTASVNMPDHDCPEGHIYIKNWSENEGMVEYLQGKGIIGEIVSYVNSGFVTVPLCKLRSE